MSLPTSYPRGSGMETAMISNYVLQLLADSSSGGGGGVSQAYVDASLGERDVEIASLDASVGRIDGYFAGGYTGTFPIVDGSTVNVTDGLITGITP